MLRLAEEDTFHSSAQVKRLLEDVSNEPDLAKRIDFISACFLGHPYIANSLGGGEGLPEVLTISLDGFDCVTYMEIVLALAISKNTNDFITTIREIRYEGGKVAWRCRNHYMTAWARNNCKRGFVRNLTRGPNAIRKTRT